MPTEKEFDLVMDQILDYARDLDDVVSSEYVEEIAGYESDRTNEEYSFTGHRFINDDNVYIVAGHPDFRFMAVIHFISMKGYMMTGIDEELASDILGEQADEQNNLIEHAADKLIENTPDDDLETMKSFIYMMVSAGDHETVMSLENDDEDAFDVITSESHIFPFEDDFGIKEFHNARRSVLTAGKRATKLVQRSIYLNVNEKTPTESKLHFDYNW